MLMPRSHRSTILRLLPFLFFILTFSYLFAKQLSHGVSLFQQSYFQQLKADAPRSYTEGYPQNLLSFWTVLASALEKAQPTVPQVSILPDTIDEASAKYEPQFVTKVRPQGINLTVEDETILFHKHYLMRDAAQDLGPKLPYNTDTTGIVSTAGGRYIPIFIMSLRMLRRTGSNLPVELFLDNSSDYDKDICETLLPSLNARCRVLSDIYDKVPGVNKLEHFQFKVFSILFSSFQNVLFLDADSFPAHDPRHLFSQAPYTTHGLVTWPDFWANTASSHYYHIAGIPEVPVSARFSTESGQLLLDKAKHAESLLMMVYYNYYGPSHYYPLLSQGAAGMGDKETFIHAAMAMDLPFYQVQVPCHAMGFWADGNFNFHGLAQRDPVADFTYKAPSRSHFHDSAVWEDKDYLDRATARVLPKPLFIHANMIKFDPSLLARPDARLRKGNDGKYVRMWGTEQEVVEIYGYDLEKRIWTEMQKEACRTDQDACDKVKSYNEQVFGNRL